MKKFILFLVLLGVVGCWWDKKLVPTPVPPPIVNPTPVPNLDDLGKALLVAQKEDKPVYLFLSEDNCIFCKMMEQNVHPRVDLTHHVFVETKDPALWHKFNIEAFPTNILIDKNGKEIKRSVGYMTVRELTNWLR